MKSYPALISLAASICFIAASPAALVISDNAGQVALYSDDGDLLKTYVTGLSNAQGVAVDSAGGFVYAADYGGSVTKYQLTTGALVGTVSSTLGTVGLALSSSSDLVAVVRGTNTNFIHFNTGGTNSVIGTSPSFDPTYEGIALGGGILFSANSQAGGLVQGFDAVTGNYLDIANFDFTGPRGVASSADGSLVYVGDNGTNEIRLWNRVSGTTGSFANLEGAFGVTLNQSNGDVWASSLTTGEIARFDLAGNKISGFTLPEGARYIAYTSVPEPAAASLALLSLFAGLRRRR